VLGREGTLKVIYSWTISGRGTRTEDKNSVC